MRAAWEELRESILEARSLAYVAVCREWPTLLAVALVAALPTLILFYALFR